MAQKKALDQFWSAGFAATRGTTSPDSKPLPMPAILSNSSNLICAIGCAAARPGTFCGTLPPKARPTAVSRRWKRNSPAYSSAGRGHWPGPARFIEAAIGPEAGRRGTTFLLILGPSGAGKSSFLRAGLLPRMRDAGVPAFLEDGSDAINAFRTVMLLPHEMGEDLCLGLARALYEPASHGRCDVGLAQLAEGTIQHRRPLRRSRRAAPSRRRHPSFARSTVWASTRREPMPPPGRIGASVC